MLKDDFDKASIEVNSLKQRPGNEDLLLLYAYYKQALQGDVKSDKPTGFDFKAMAKFTAWEKLKGMSTNEAMQKYVDLINELKEKVS